MPTITYKSFDGEQVSKEWYALLTDIREEDNVAFHLNEGHRTMARQWFFWNCHKNCNCNNCALAAFPSPTAPHIRTGRCDHACDFNGAEGVRKAAAKRGVTLTRTVTGEEWHLEANAAHLKSYYAAHGRKPRYRMLKRGSRGEDVQRYMVMLRALGYYPKKASATKGYGIRMGEAVRSWNIKHGQPHNTILHIEAQKQIERRYEQWKKEHR